MICEETKAKNWEIPYLRYSYFMIHVKERKCLEFHRTCFFFSPFWKHPNVRDVRDRGGHDLMC